MPGMDGLELMRAIVKSHSIFNGTHDATRARKTPRLFLISGGDITQFTQGEKDFLTQNKIEVLLKPVSKEGLAKALALKQ
jgi:CheY-like chemotaxis protein